MLYDLSFLDIGQKFPPKCECERLELYHKNKLLFEGEHEEVYKTQFRRIQRIIGNFNDVISYAVIANYHKLITKKTIDLLLGEPPNIKSSSSESKDEQSSIDNIIENTSLFKKLTMCGYDVSRFGDGCLIVYKDKDTGAGQIDVTQPSMWFKVVDPMNIQRVLFQVLAFVNEEMTELKVQIHGKGKYEERTLKMDGGEIKAVISSGNMVTTGLTDFAVIPISNLLTSDKCYGQNDYSDLDSIISEIEVRCSQIAKVLDKHSDPTLEAPESACEYDPNTGELVFKIGNTILKGSKEDPDSKYLVWDGQMEANFKYLELLINNLYIISEMGSAVFGDMTKNIGQVPSGSALKRLMISPLAKVNRIRQSFDPEVKKAIKLASQLGGKNIKNLSDSKINITWNDGLPADPLEEANIADIRTGRKPTQSQFNAIKKLDNVDDATANEELDRIMEEEAMSNPTKTSPFSGDNIPNNQNNNL